MFKISISKPQADSNEKSFEYMKSIKDMGFDAVDYSNLALEPGKGLYSFGESDFEAFIKRDAEYAKQIGLDIFQIHGPWPFDEHTPYDLKFDATVRAIKGCALLGAEYTVIHPHAPCGWAPSSNRKEDINANIEFTRRLLPYAKEYNVKIALENMPNGNMPAGTVKELAETIDIIGSEYCVACLDTGHANFMGDDSGDAVLTLGDRIGCLHIHDNNGQTDSHCIPYTHNINWKSFTDALKKIKYSGVINLETAAYKGPQELEADYNALLYKTAKYLAKQVSE